MKKGIISVVILLFGFQLTPINAQTASASDNIVAQPIPDRTVSYSVADAGVSKPILWGLDLAWLSETNIRRGIAFMGGTDGVDIVRSSFMPTNPLVGDTALQGIALTNTNLRLNIIDTYLGANTQVALNSDHPSVDSYFAGNAAHWAALIDITTSLHEEQGRTVVSVAPFNEPDYSATGQGTIADFYNICGELRNNSHFDAIRISGGNTLNPDYALDWYNYLKGRLDEGNTHQLAGTFDNYATFYATVRANGDHATNDELHNVMEAMVGVEYGMQTGIWWGAAEYARGEFCKASDGVRLGYAEHRNNWTAASVYRAPDGKTQAFTGGSERQATTTTYRFFSKDRDVYYDGYGPQREFVIEHPGGTGYEENQPSAEKVINITWGDDIQPVVDGTYVIVNRNSGKVMSVSNTSLGANISQGTFINYPTQKWNVTPVDSRVGGDFSYFSFNPVSNDTMTLDVANYSLDNGGNIQQWGDGKSANQQWYLEYAGDGWFYIRNRHSAQCLEVADASTAHGANIQQWVKDEGYNQQWRFVAVSTSYSAIEFISPAAPSDLAATVNAESVQLDWTANTETDVTGYTIFRAESAGGPYNTIARNVKTPSFVDNTATTGGPYYYAIKAVDKHLNRSGYSNEVSATATGNNDLVARLQFEGNTLDSTINLNHSAAYGGTSFVAGNVDSQAISLNGTDAFVQLPSNLANHQEITIATWVYWKGNAAWARIFDFGNGEDENMYLTPRSDASKLRFAIKNGGVEQSLNATAMLSLNKWVHVAVTLGTSAVRMYVDGQLAAESNTFTISPLDFKPALNYIGRSQYPDPLFKGYVDDFVVFNYALSADEVADVYSGVLAVDKVEADCNRLSLWPVPANNVLHVSYSTVNKNSLSMLAVFDMNGRLVLSKDIQYINNTELNVSDLPSGIYMLRLTNSEETLMKKLIIKH